LKVIREAEVPGYQLVGRSTHLLVGPDHGARDITHNVSYFVPGHAPGHVHDPEEEVFYVDEGEGEVWIEGVPYDLRPGTAVHTPQLVEHNVHVRGETPMRIIGTFSPHVVPGRYPNLPARSYDLPAPPTNRAPFIVYADELAGAAGRLTMLATDRIELSLLRLEPGSGTTLESGANDLVVQVLSGSMVVEGVHGSAEAERGTTLLLVEPEKLRMRPETSLRCLVVEAVTAR
jgi:mannose-6-phosphate isomerase-like protein (cupin superfamily)